MHMQMKTVSLIPQPLHAIDALEDTLATQSRNLYFLLTQLVSGQAFVLLRAVPDQHRHEAWRRLCAQYEPTTRTRSLALLVCCRRSCRQISRTILQWEAEGFRYERA
eukprot:3681269-Amphidinium_carterae.1